MKIKLIITIYTDNKREEEKIQFYMEYLYKRINAI